MTYEIYLYDVWGNEKDGYTVNDVIPTGKIVEKDITMQKLCEILGLDSPNKLRMDDFNDDCVFIYDGKPYFELREVEENEMPRLQ